MSVEGSCGRSEVAIGASSPRQRHTCMLLTPQCVCACVSGGDNVRPLFICVGVGIRGPSAA